MKKRISKRGGWSGGTVKPANYGFAYWLFAASVIIVAAVLLMVFCIEA